MTVRRFLLIGVGTLALWGGGVRADALFYKVENDRVVFTNVESTQTRPVPGIQILEAIPDGGLPPTIYDAFIERLAREHGLSPRLIKAVALVESGFDPHAVSAAGAQGLMQLMPATARHYGVRDPFDPLENLRAGSLHLRHLLDLFDGDLTLALAAYNAGPDAVRRSGGVPDYPETLDYVFRVHERIGQVPTGIKRRRAAPDRPAVRLVRMPDGTWMLRN